ncbi:MAG TPA: hypothetical protein PLX14_15490 [Anaerolineales bacterium]|nr:hypothetical protein [Anaerolineales bacterium]HNC10114.1 hypothetical protein [Anaerolineales bacterium]
MKKNRMKNTLENIARRGVPENINLMPHIAAQLERKSPMTTLRTRPFVAILIAIFILLTLSGVAYALGRVFGYIPGVGIVDQSTPLRALAEPVSLTRDGVTVTITQAILTPEETVITLKVEKIPFDASPLQPHTDLCSGKTSLRMEDGQTLEGYFDGEVAGTAFPTNRDGTLLMRLVYPPIKKNLDDSVLLLDCIFDTVVGKLPTNWEIPFQFISKTPEMTPVVEIQTPTPELSVTPISNSTSYPSTPLSVVKALDVSGSYILFIELDYDRLSDFVKDDSSLPINATWVNNGIFFKDGNGNDLAYNTPFDIEMPTPIHPNGQVMAFKIKKDFKLPLTIIAHGVYKWEKDTQQFTFTMDAGENPQTGQIWQINKDFNLNGFNFRLASISVDQMEYNFHFDNSTGGPLMDFLNIKSVDILGFPSIGGGGGMGDMKYQYQTIPSGNLTITFTASLTANGKEQNWQVQWKP